MTILERWRAVKPVVAILALCIFTPSLVTLSLDDLLRYHRYIDQYNWLDEDTYHIAVEQARHHRLNPSLVLAVIDAESRGNPRAVSKAKARGLMQVMAKHWYDGDPMDLHIPRVNIQRGCAVLRWAYDLAKGDIVLTLRNYERGPRGRGINWTYTNKILKNMRG
jgi:soluble lytic murein transglycosylase-like protein